jgi:hypothetical protein
MLLCRGAAYLILYLATLAFLGNCRFHVVSYMIVDPDEKTDPSSVREDGPESSVYQTSFHLTFQRASRMSHTRP